MSSMDYLRDKLRAGKQDTQDLPVYPPSVAEPKVSFRRPAPVFTDELPGTAELDASVFQESAAAPASPPPAEATVKRRLPFLDKLQQLEVNRKMLLVSLGVAALATLLSMSYIKGIAEPLKGQARLVRVVTLLKDVPARTPLSEEMVQIREVPAAYVPEGATIVEQGKPPVVLGMLTVTPLYKGEMLMKGRMAAPSAATGLATQIPEGHRAMTVRTDNAYLMKPGDYVDIFAAISDPNPARRDKIISIPVLQRAKILAVGNQFTAESSNNQAGSIPREITVAVPDERVNLMTILEQSNGKFNVVQRAAGDQKIRPEQYTIQEIEDALQGKFEAAPALDIPDPKEEKPAASKPVKEEDPVTDEDISKLVDLSQPAAPAAPVYRAPVRSYRPARVPARSYSAPARRPVAAPARAAAPVRAAAPPVRRAPVVIQGGVTTQSGE